VYSRVTKKRTFLGPIRHDEWAFSVRGLFRFWQFGEVVPFLATLGQNKFAGGHMEDQEIGTDLLLRAEAVRLIAQGIYDNAEREVELQFMADAVKLAALITSKKCSGRRRRV
jgi:hypothetical protein